MSRRARLALFVVAALALAVALVHGLAGLPDFGDFHGVSGTLLRHVTVGQRKATDVITAITFDYRGMDTMGEELILFAASVGLVVLLREQRGEHHDSDGAAPADEGRRPQDGAGRPPATSPTLIVVCRWLVGPILVLGVYVASHGQLTPGGGSRAEWCSRAR